ncbi:MAG: hypothetical protein HRT35_32595, partial [Algicola sp.]|nr:hypothetical protein [Algicola sp.]
MTEQIQLAANTISAAACLRGSVKPDQQDLWPLIFAIPTEQGQEQAR